MSGIQVNASFGFNTKEGSENPHNILVLFFDCKERERGPKKNQIFYLPEPWFCLPLQRGRTKHASSAEFTWGVRNKENATLDVSMAKQKRKREALALATIVKLSSAKLLRPISHPPRGRRRTHHRPGRRCCVTQSEEQVSKYSVLGTSLPPEKLQNLEQSWSMKVGSLKLVTLANTIYLRDDFGQAYLDGHWLLIPPINTLVMVYESYKDLDPGDTNRWHEALLPEFFKPEPLEYVLVPLTSRGRDLLTLVAPLKDDPTLLSNPFLCSSPTFEGPIIIASFHPFFAIARAIQLRRTVTLPPQHDKWLYILEIEWRRRYKPSVSRSLLQPPKTTKKRKRRPESEDDIPSPKRKRTNLSWGGLSEILNAQPEPAIPSWRANVRNGTQTDGALALEELGAYCEEACRYPPVREWSAWRPDWSIADHAEKSACPDTRKFSSNDWAFYRSQTLLPGTADLDFQTRRLPQDGPKPNSEHDTSGFRRSPTPSIDQSKW